MVFEFLENGSVIDFLNKRRRAGKVIGAEEKLRILTDAARGCVYLAKRKIVHRDLACRNLLVSASLQVRVSDLGLSRALSGQSNEYYRSSGGAVAIKWASAEVLQQGQIGVKSDVCSFGLTAFELFSDGLAPFVSLSNEDAARIILQGSTAMAKHLVQPPECPDRLYQLMKQCWEANPSDRPTMRRVLKVLKSMSNDDGSDESSGEQGSSVNLYSKTPTTDPSQNTYSRTPADAGSANESSSGYTELEPDAADAGAYQTPTGGAYQSPIALRSSDDDDDEEDEAQEPSRSSSNNGT
jgi:serine/threonine protein kinase